MMKIWHQRHDNNSVTINIHAPCISIPQTFYILVCCCNVCCCNVCSAFNIHVIYMLCIVLRMLQVYCTVHVSSLHVNNMHVTGKSSGPTNRHATCTCMLRHVCNMHVPNPCMLHETCMKTMGHAYNHTHACY